LGGQIVKSAEASGAQRTELGALLLHVQSLLAAAPPAAKGAKKARSLDYSPILTRLRALDAGKAPTP
jgi:hypothetical protein